MAGERDDKDFQSGPDWGDKTDFAIGVPVDPNRIPELFYQVIAGSVHTLLRFKDGGVSRGIVPLADLEKLAGQTIAREGWYDALGTWVGTQLPGSLG